MWSLRKRGRTEVWKRGQTPFLQQKWDLTPFAVALGAQAPARMSVARELESVHVLPIPEGAPGTPAPAQTRQVFVLRRVPAWGAGPAR